MVVLMRRISYLKLILSETTESQYKVLEDVSDFPDFIYNLMITKRMTPFDFVKTYFPDWYKEHITPENPLFKRYTDASGVTKPVNRIGSQQLQSSLEQELSRYANNKEKLLSIDIKLPKTVQKQIQNVIIQAMGYTPGFDAYQVRMPEVAGYKPYTVYNNQKTIDNRANLRMFGGTDKLHQDMIYLK
jgi:hypothetical protein